MNYVSNEFQEKQQRGLMATMFGDSNFKGLDNNESGGTYTYNNCKYVRIVVQESSKAPYILVLKMKS